MVLFLMVRSVPFVVLRQPVIVSAFRESTKKHHIVLVTIWCFLRVRCVLQVAAKQPQLRQISGNYAFFHPHLGHTPFSLRAMPQRGQRSMLVCEGNSSVAAFTPLVKVSFTILSLSFNRS